MNVSLSAEIITATTSVATQAPMLEIEGIWGISWGWLLEKITKNLSAIIAGIALFIAIFQAHAMQKHNQLSVIPLLSIKIRDGSINDMVDLVYELRNAGNGPAIIRHYSIFIGDKEYVINTAAAALAFEDLMLSYSFLHPRVTAIGTESVIAKGECHNLLRVKIRVPEIGDKKILGLLGFKIRFQSIYRNETFDYIVDNAIGYPKKQSKTKLLLASCYASLREKVKGVWL